MLISPGLPWVIKAKPQQQQLPCFPQAASVGSFLTVTSSYIALRPGSLSLPKIP